MYETKKHLQELRERFESYEAHLGVLSKMKRLSILEQETSDPNLWHDQEKARTLLQETSSLREELKEIKDVRDTLDLLESMANDESTEAELKEETATMEKRMQKLELTSYLSGKYDKKNSIFSIHAGQGGTEAMDWSAMLYRMYTRFCERRGWAMEVLDETQGEEAGIKSVVFKISGLYSYGYLKRESGTHRLVRQSPFNADNLRQTSFAMVDVMPEIEESDEPDVVIRDEDLDISFTRAGGHGGQNVNKVSTAVRIVHRPTGIVVACRTERFQEQNRKYAMSMLRAKLWALEQAKALKEKQDIKGDYVPPSWGTQIRSYVLHPYKMVKDLRTDVETGNTDAVLDGDLEEFIEAELKLK